MRRLRAWYAKLADALESGMKQRITRAGFLFTGAIAAIAFAAFASANNLLFLILAAMLATLMVSGFISRLSLAGLELEFLHPEHISARRKVAGRIIVHNDKFWIASFAIRLAGTENAGVDSVLYFPAIPAGKRLEETVELYFPKRGRYTENTFSFSTRFPFGFAERRVQVRVQQDVLVYPSVDPKPGFEQMMLNLTGDIAAYFRGRGSDFYRIRPYENLESARHVDWRATAHTGELQVREFAREQEQTILLFLDLEQNEGATFEAAVDTAAFLAWNFTQRNARIRFSTQEAQIRTPEDGDVYTILKYLALVAPVHGRSAPPPDDQNGFQVVVSAAPDRLASAGWAGTRGVSAYVIDPSAFAGAPAQPNDAAPAASGKRR